MAGHKEKKRKGSAVKKFALQHNNTAFAQN